MSGSDTVKVLTKIARAMERGTIIGSDVQKLGTSVAVQLFTHGESPEIVAWYVRQFPGGEHRLYQRAAFRSRGNYTAHRARHWDRWQYAVEIGRAHLWVRYSLPHECVDFKALSEHVRLAGDATQHYPRWFCQACGKDMTITEARRRGLMPPLVRGRS